MGPVGVEVSAEDSVGLQWVMVTFLCDSLEFDRMIDLGCEIAAECRPMLGKVDERLVINVVSGVG
jgi:hypothetical protein